jgi:DNA-directed RNA polymerase specialized sigma24 family protein
MDSIDGVTEQILNEVLKECDNILWKLARTTKVPGFDADDLMQEMRIKIWKTVKNNHYDPERVKPTSFYYRVCKNHLINLNASKIYKYKTTSARKRCYRDILDQKVDLCDELMPEVVDFPLNFVQNFSSSFAQLVLPTEELNENSRTNKQSSRIRGKKHQKQV